MNCASRKRLLVAGAGMAALIAFGTSAQGQVIATQALAGAQAAPTASVTGSTPIASSGAPQETTVTEVQVTASRIGRKGFVAPTPTTILTASDLQLGGTTNLGQALEDLPSYNSTISAAGERGTTSAGTYLANLRDLGAPSTLVLIDGARPVATDPIPFGFDLNMVPLSLVDHVEVVTGGASAQWGSDAVAGVVNIVMKKSMQGVEADIQQGGDFEGLGSDEWKASLAAGASFDSGRGQVMFGASYDQVRGIYPATKSPIGNSGIIPNPNYTATNGQPQGLFVTGLLNNNASIGGLITSGPLKGTNFGPGGATSAFNYGQYGLLATSGALMVGGDPSARYFPGSTESLISPLVRENFYGRGSYDLSSRTQLTVDLLVAHTQSDGPFWTQENAANITIANTNAYLPSQIVSAMAADKITSFTLGRQNLDFGPMIEDDGNTTAELKVGLNGGFGSTWTWDAFYSFGETQRKETIGNQELSPNFANAVAAVKSPTTGQPICKIALTTPSTNCVPIDLFGEGSPSAAALAYVLGNSLASTWLYQHEAAANLRGEPFSVWAGPVSIATGFEFRDEGVTGRTDPLTQAGDFVYASSTLSDGSYSVAEAYFETVVPLIKDQPLMKKLDFNGAVRVSDYSTSGVLDSWKVGLTDQVTHDFLLRGTLSHDVEAPNLQELYTTTALGIGTITNPLTNTAVAVSEYTGGNKNLTAEQATTYTGGFTYQPRWLQGLSLSTDYYNINITGAIGTVAAQSIVNQCYEQKISAACAEITTVNGEPSIIHATYINYSTYEDSGVDIELDYAFDLKKWGVPGSFRTKWLTTYINTLKETTGPTVTRLVGQIANPGAPRWRSLFTADYDCGPLDFTARVRYAGGGAYLLTETVNTPVEGQAYLDLGAKWTLPTKEKMVLYMNVNNVTNDVYAEGATANSSIFDYIGRTYDVGLKLNF